MMGSQVQPIFLVTRRTFVWCLLNYPVSVSVMQGYTVSVMPWSQGNTWKQAAIFIFLMPVSAGAVRRRWGLVAVMIEEAVA